MHNMRLIFSSLIILFCSTCYATDFTADSNNIGAWNMEATSGDETGVSQNTYTITDVNSIGTANGRLTGTKSRDFEEDSDQYFSCTDGNCPALDINGANVSLSIIAWIQLEALGTDASPVVTKYDGGTSTQRQYWLGLDSSEKMDFIISSDGVNLTGRIQGDTALAAGTWYHIAGVYNDTDMRIYLDGIPDATAVVETAGIADEDEDFHVGMTFWDGAIDDEWDGLIDEVMIFDDGLSAEEVNEIMRNGIDGTWTLYINPLFIQDASQLHPDVIYFDNAVDGYKFWMTWTPFPPSTDEHPSISRSNDCAVWTQTGISNPVVDTSYEAEPDPDILYIADYKKWFMAFSVEDAADPYNTHICFAYSTDGLTWTEYDGTVINSNTNPVILSGTDDGGVAWEVITATGESRVQYPALIYEAGIFTLFYGETTGNAADADDGGKNNNVSPMGSVTFKWDNATNDITNFVRNANNPFFAPAKTATYWYGAGHFDVTYLDGTYHLYCLRREDSGTELADMWHYTSTDKETWAGGTAVITKGVAGTWNAYEIYRGSIIHNGEGGQVTFDGSAKMVYSAASVVDVFKIGLDDVGNFSIANPVTGLSTQNAIAFGANF